MLFIPVLLDSEKILSLLPPISGVSFAGWGQVLMGKLCPDTALALGQGEPVLVQLNLAVCKRFKYKRIE